MIREERKELRRKLRNSSGTRASWKEKREYSLCKNTGRSRQELIILIGKHKGNPQPFLEEIGYSRKVRIWLYKIDNGYWKLMCFWMRYYINEYEKRFYTFMDEIINAPSPEEIIKSASEILDISTDVLLALSNNKINVELFLESNRPALAVLAEVRLWKRVDEGDMSAIKLVLTTQKQDIYDLKNKKEDKEDRKFTIQMVEKERNE